MTIVAVLSHVVLPEVAPAPPQVNIIVLEAAYAILGGEFVVHTTNTWIHSAYEQIVAGDWREAARLAINQLLRARGQEPDLFEIVSSEETPGKMGKVFTEGLIRFGPSGKLCPGTSSRYCDPTRSYVEMLISACNYRLSKNF